MSDFNSATKISISKDSLYQRIYNLVVTCGTEKKKSDFLKCFLAELKDFISFDTAWIILLDGSGNDIDWIFDNDDLHWRWLYREFYKKETTFRLKYFTGLKESTDTTYLTLIDWDQERGSFVDDYIRKRGIHYSLAFPLFDNNGVVSCIYRLDLTDRKAFPPSEIEELDLALVPINLLYKRFCPSEINQGQQAFLEQLTPREKEISTFLCSGVPIQKISEHCNISIATVRKHIEHLYKKTGVNSLQEYLILMLKQS